MTWVYYYCILNDNVIHKFSDQKYWHLKTNGGMMDTITYRNYILNSDQVIRVADDWSTPVYYKNRDGGSKIVTEDLVYIKLASQPVW